MAEGLRLDSTLSLSLALSGAKRSHCSSRHVPKEGKEAACSDVTACNASWIHIPEGTLDANRLLGSRARGRLVYLAANLVSGTLREHRSLHIPFNLSCSAHSVLPESLRRFNSSVSLLAIPPRRARGACEYRSKPRFSRRSPKLSNSAGRSCSNANNEVTF